MRALALIRPWLPPLPIWRGPATGLRWDVTIGHGKALWNGYEPAGLRAVAKTIYPGSVLYDIGAHVGLYTLLAARAGAVVHAFEPDATNRASLQHHLTLNRLTATIHPVAVSAQSGVTGWTPGLWSAMGHVSATGSPMTTVALDDLDLPRPTLIKIDVEGAEAAVLGGATRLLTTARPVLLIEVHTPETADVCRTCLAGLDYNHRLIASRLLLAYPRPG